MTTVSLVIPSYGRAKDLGAALDSALRQDFPFDEVIVVARADDPETKAVAEAREVIVATINEPGVLAAMESGAQRATSDVVAFTDDDARLPRDHASRLRSYFGQSGIFGVGGRDVLYDGDVPRPTSLTHNVGRVRWFGRVVGNHHRGEGAVRPVFMLKGVNAAYRRSALAFPVGLRGQGAQPHFEVAIGTWIARQRGMLLYDPSLTVEHHPAERRGDDQRTSPSYAAILDSAYNLARSLPRRLLAMRLIYVFLLGDTNCPGIGRSLVALVRRERSVLNRRHASWRGTAMAWADRGQPLIFEECRP
jgi:glycosyltransferase involved in cell wall biosynthesis